MRLPRPPCSWPQTSLATMSSRRRLSTDLRHKLWFVLFLLSFTESIESQNLASFLKEHMLPLSQQMYGCRVVQKAIEALPLELRVGYH